MKRVLFFMWVLFAAVAVCAQSPYFEYEQSPTFLHSKYNGMLQNVMWPMQAYANLSVDSPVQKLGGHAVGALFEVKVDLDSVYDRSYKIYAAQFNDFAVKYTTYAEADRLSVEYKGKVYELSALDGGMDVHIKPLAHQYTVLKIGERLRLDLLDDLPLTAADKSKLLLRKGSFCVFGVTEGSPQ